MTPAQASDTTFAKYKQDTPEKRMQIVYDIMASLEAAHRSGDTPKYRYFIGLSQEINNWNLRKNKALLCKTASHMCAQRATSHRPNE